MNVEAHSGLGGYKVRSLYFDSIYDNHYFDKIDGPELRKKSDCVFILRTGKCEART